MFKHVIVPLDTWAFAEHAIPCAMTVARASAATLHLVHVHVSPFDGMYLEDVGQNLDLRERDHEVAYLAEVRQRVESVDGLELAVRLLDGAVTPALVTYTQELESPLVVMATHGRGGLSRSWLGSSADHYLQHARSPVLLVRPGTEEPVDLHSRPALRHVLIALDGSTLGESMLQPAAELGMPLGARYTLLRVADYGPTMDAPFLAPGFDQYPLLRQEREAEAELYLEAVAERLRESGLAVQFKVAAGLPARAILREAEELRADLIALATHGRGGAARAMLGSVADKVIRGTSLPVLTYRPPRG